MDHRIYKVSEERMKDLLNRLTYHAPQGDQPVRYNQIRDQAFELAGIFALCCPESRELSLALTNLEQAVMWANAAIARNETDS